MEESDEDGNAFAIPDLWKPSLFDPAQIETGCLQTEKWDAWNNGIDLGQDFPSEGDAIFKAFHCLDLALPDLSSFEYGPLETPAIVESLYESADDSTEDTESVEEDPWSAVNLLTCSDKPSECKGWEIFYDKGFKEPRTAYFSEGGSLALDAALRLDRCGTDNAQNIRSGRVVQSTPMLRVRNTTAAC